MPERRGPIRFGVFEVDLAAGELRRNGARVKLQEQPFQVLAALLERPGEIVTKEELQERIWKDDTFVDFDRSLATAVNKVRQALGDSATRPRFVETVPKRGYRFICALDVPPEAGTVPGSDAATPDIGTSTPSPGGKPAWPPRGPWVAAAVLAVTAAIVGVFWIINSPQPTLGPLAPVPLTSYPGIERSPSFSPDGNQVAFSWNGSAQDNFDIYVQLVGSANPKRLTNDPRPDYRPAWSPDGRNIAFFRQFGEGHYGVMLIPALGGPERQVAEVSGWLLVPSLNHLLSWTPDSRRLVTSDKASTDGPFSLHSISVDSGEKRRLTSPPAGNWGDFEPALSPDGRFLVFRRTIAPPASGNLFLAELTEDYSPAEQPRQITFTTTWTKEPAWTPNGEEVVFVDDYALWRINPHGPGKPARLPLSGARALTPAFSPQGNHFSYQRLLQSTNLWKVEVPPGGGEAKVTLSPISSTSDDANADYSPDGSRVVFQSKRSGHLEIWVSKTDGSEAVQLTSYGGPEAGSPSWSPDGKRVAFDSIADGDWDIYVINSDGGKPRKLTSHPGGDWTPDWSQDGQWIYFSSNRSGDTKVWKMPSQGGEAVQVTQSGGTNPVESSDGRFVYYRKRGRGSQSLWRKPVSGGQEQLVLQSIHNACQAVVDGGIYFVPPPAAGEEVVLHFFDFATNSSRPIAALGERVYFWLGASRDGRSVLYSRPEETSDLMLVENFE